MRLSWSHFLINLATLLVVAGGVWTYLRPAPAATRFESRPSLGEIADVCRLMSARPHWWRALLEAERRWEVPPHLALAIMWRESSFVADARPLKKRFFSFLPPKRLSSAYGYAQALDGTWEWYLRETTRRGARREAFADAADFIGWYLDRSRRELGLSFEKSFDHYAAYHQGHAGYARGGWRENPVVLTPARDVALRTRLYESQMADCMADYAARQAPAESPEPRPRPQAGRSAAL
ncbi:transglycosylase SLT domain-containing protein [Neomegalonema perideroedes]|uniref:transglycosylase SLT domain-containing protein n=1 Tax=Neomegalonema perideroedes TaxID=217219 RepID=UPI00037B4E07|nr:hypothetical protein [Neomegalonema perideroedes]